jgi:hypothetical protein
MKFLIFKKMIINDPDLSDLFISYFIKRRCTSEKKMGITGNKIEDRISFVIHFFNIEVHDASGEEFLLYKLFTQKDLSDRSGATRHTILAILKKNQFVALRIPENRTPFSLLKFKSSISLTKGAISSSPIFGTSFPEETPAAQATNPVSICLKSEK